MSHEPAVWSDPLEHIRRTAPDEPVFYFSPAALSARARRFLEGFPGLVTYAVKANDTPEVLQTLAQAGIRAFDVASVPEMEAVRAAVPGAVLHYNNPVRSVAEVARARALGVRSWSVDSLRELEKLGIEGPEHEVSARIALPVTGAAYHFGEKFGDSPEDAARLLAAASARGVRLSVTFHPGTQCQSPGAWRAYVHAAARTAELAGVRLSRLNVGGGFPVRRMGTAPRLETLFATIRSAVDEAFGDNAPALVCEPGRAMVADAFELVTRVKTVRLDGAVFLNDGIYGGLSELRDIGVTDRVRAYAPDGTPRTGRLVARRVFGPTCDSLDVLPQPLRLPTDLEPEDYVLFSGMGAYSLTVATRFNGYGRIRMVTTRDLGDRD